MQELAGLTALIIEPHAGMRASIHNMLSIGGISKIEYAASSGSAIRPLKHKMFDLVICEYDLGEGQDGQQLLEDLRHHKIIPPSTVFIMVTAERNHEKVVSAAELALNDYVLKPFTAETLMDRIAKAIEKRNAFIPIYQLIEHGNLSEAINACVASERTHTRYQAEFIRLRAELHITLGELTEAEAIYSELFAKRSIAWARLGLATSLYMQDRFEEAEEMLTSLVAEKKQFLEAYDWLAKTQEARGQMQQAQTTLEHAVTRSPHALQRLRKLGNVALETGDTETAHRVFQQVINKAKFSEFREPEDHVHLVKTSIAKGEVKLVSSIIRDLAKSLANIKKTPACRALAAAMLHKHNGDTELAVEELGAAVLACKEPIGLSNDTKMTLALNCLENGMEQDAVEVMTSVVGNASTNVAMTRAMRLFREAGREDLGKRVTRESKSQVVDLVSAGAEKARLGDYHGAVALMSEAADKLPENPQVVFNAAVAVLKCLDSLGWDEQLGEQARTYISNARRLDPRNPRLSLLASMYRDILKKYAMERAYGVLPAKAVSNVAQIEKQ
ncbi:response regulator [Herminiimonas arsenitoxidans]|uniref:response regulator n=1 Tax=Herminiimonas arsenitoxidans TaxID=1809410 RepID=UPI0009714639|nr:response regulator [Herminiimonas arsenitoxidans]